MGVSAGATILVVEDDPALRRTALRLLEGRLGYQVILASRAEEALARVDLGQRVDLVLSDLNLGDMDGLALHAQLRQRGFAGAFLLTSGDEAHTIAARKGAIPPEIGFLPRPWSIDELTLAVRNALGNG
jgi:CheY-like chemotaxis protein